MSVAVLSTSSQEFQRQAAAVVSTDLMAWRRPACASRRHRYTSRPHVRCRAARSSSSLQFMTVSTQFAPALILRPGPPMGLTLCPSASLVSEDRQCLCWGSCHPHTLAVGPTMAGWVAWQLIRLTDPDFGGHVAYPDDGGGARIY